MDVSIMIVEGALVIPQTARSGPKRRPGGSKVAEAENLVAHLAEVGAQAGLGSEDEAHLQWPPLPDPLLPSGPYLVLPNPSLEPRL